LASADYFGTTAIVGFGEGKLPPRKSIISTPG